MKKCQYGTVKQVCCHYILCTSPFHIENLMSIAHNSPNTYIDLCLLKSEDKMKFPMDQRAGNCSNLKGGKGCGVGLGHVGHVCYPPYSSRLHFKRGLVGYSDGSKQTLTDTFTRLAQLNVSVVFIGDSTTRQKVVAMDCQLKRESWKNYISGLTYRSILPCHSKMTIGLNKGVTTLDLHQISMGPNSKQCLEGGVGNTNHIVGVYENARHIVNYINKVENRSVLLLANLGLWYNDVDSFDVAVPHVLNWLKDVSMTGGEGTGAKNIVAWHETMRQHYDSDIGNGYFIKEVVDAKEASWNTETFNYFYNVTVKDWHVPNCCQDIRLPGNDWRNEIVTKHVKEKKLEKNIMMLDFADATTALSDMHICHPYFKDDCTHYCFSPLLFQPLWYQLQNISIYMEAKAGMISRGE